MTLLVEFSGGPYCGGVARYGVIRPDDLAEVNLATDLGMWARYLPTPRTSPEGRRVYRFDRFEPISPPEHVG